MARNLSDKVSDAGKSIVDAAQKLGHDIAEGTQKAVQSVSEMATGEGKDLGTAAIREHMQVYASCGKMIGSVDHLTCKVMQSS